MGAFLFSLAVLTLWAFVWSLMFKGDLNFKEVVLLLPSIVALVHQFRRNKVKAKPFRLTASFDSGIFGGFAGGIIAGLIIGILYGKLGGSVWAAVVSVLTIVSAAAI